MLRHALKDFQAPQPEQYVVMSVLVSCCVEVVPPLAATVLFHRGFLTHAEKLSQSSFSELCRQRDTRYAAPTFGCPWFRGSH